MSDPGRTEETPGQTLLRVLSALRAALPFLFILGFIIYGIYKFKCREYP